MQVHWHLIVVLTFISFLINDLGMHFHVLTSTDYGSAKAQWLSFILNKQTFYRILQRNPHLNLNPSLRRGKGRKGKKGK